MLPPLPQRLRPKTLDEYIGQKHLVAPEALLGSMIAGGNLSSLILWGPPGVGKTTLAEIIAATLGREFYTLSAVTSGVKEVREIIDRASQNSLFGGGKAPILFIDEIHRFNKAQQDSLLGCVEKGVLVLIGATTENPSFEVITPLLSRCQVFVLKPLGVDDLKELLNRAITQDVLLKTLDVQVKEEDALFRYSGGDGRRMLNILEMVVSKAQTDGNKKIIIDNAGVEKALLGSTTTYDKNGEMHYDIISAFIKSVRGSDPNAAVYYLARMLGGGEDPLFIARRLCILAAEDIGLANPNALLLANACYQIVHSIGMPESRIPLSETTIYLASSPKSNSAYLAIDNALQVAEKTFSAPVPLAIRNAPTSLMKDLGYSDGYKYAHDFPGHFAELEFMPEALKGTKFYSPAENPKEEAMKNHLRSLWKDKYEY
ncbi:MAG: replication-associated recombination protein A [Bacteroidales bacterium]|nr:replication-associated recombination protein A [Bacteroidales bacterium]